MAFLKLGLIWVTTTALALWLVCGGDWSIFTDSSDIRWLVMGDRAYGLMGWLDYLKHSWPIPHRTTSHFVYPLPSNVALTDSNPLLAIIAKFFSDGQFTVWHPYGYWLILCFSLQSFFAALIARRLIASSILLRFFFTLFVTISPPLLARNGHLALMAHWIILATFILGTRRDNKFWATNYLGWMVLTISAAMIHPYWPPFILVMAVCCFGYEAINHPAKRLVSLTKWILSVIGLIFCTLAGFWIIGILSQPKPIDNIHIYTSDILMHFNSYGWSPFVPALFKFRSGQYEGFAYIGGGSLLIVVTYVLKKLLFKEHHYPFKKFIRPLTSLTGVSLGCLFLFLWSLGAKVRLLGFTMGYLDFIYEPFLPILGTFRSVGRFAWAMHYLIILLLFLWLSHLWRAGRRRDIIVITIIAAVIQLAEMRDKAGSFFVRDRQFVALNKSEWSELLRGKSTIELVPPEIDGTSCQSTNDGARRWLPLAILAVEEGLRFNSGTRANPPDEPSKAYCESLQNTIASGQTSSLSAYVVAPWAKKEWVEQLEKISSLKCHTVSGGYTVCI